MKKMAKRKNVKPSLGAQRAKPKRGKKFTKTVRRGGIML